MKSNIKSLLFHFFEEIQKRIPSSVSARDMSEYHISQYLNGGCKEFAFAYQHIFGGLIFCIKDHNGSVIHAWVNLNGESINANGLIDNVSKYLETEYKEDWSPQNGNPIEPFNLSMSLKEPSVRQATEFITMFKDFYQPN